LDIGSNGTAMIKMDKTGTKIGFFGSAGGPQVSVSGSRQGNQALASLINALAGLGLIKDSTS
jgi:hypothetical protein